jgi:hypothetical protein
MGGEPHPRALALMVTPVVFGGIAEVMLMKTGKRLFCRGSRIRMATDDDINLLAAA